MANALKGKTSACLVFVTPNERAIEALRVFIEGHMEYMKAKSHETGPLKLIHYSFSESPEWADNSRWHTGETPSTTERRVFHLFEIYENLEGLQHHWTETQEFIGEYYELIETHNIEVHTFNQMKIIQSLWE